MVHKIHKPFTEPCKTIEYSSRCDQRVTVMLCTDDSFEYIRAIYCYSQALYARKYLEA